MLTSNFFAAHFSPDTAMKFSLGSLKGEIDNHKRKATEDRSTRPKKYLKRGEIEKEEEDQIMKEREQKRRQDEEAQRIKMEELKQRHVSQIQVKEEVTITIPDEEVRTRLKKRSMYPIPFLSKPTRTTHYSLWRR